MNYRRNPAILAQTVDDEVVLLSADQSALLTLNATGAAVWNALEEPSSVDGIVERLTGQFPGADQKVLRADVDTFVADLHDRGVLTLDT